MLGPTVTFEYLRYSHDLKSKQVEFILVINGGRVSNVSEQKEERERACRGRSSTAKPHKTLQLVAVVLRHSCQSTLPNSSFLVTLFASPNYLQGHTHTHPCMDTHTFFWDRVLLWSPSWPWTWNSPASSSQVIESATYYLGFNLYYQRKQQQIYNLMWWLPLLSQHCRGRKIVSLKQANVTKWDTVSNKQ